MRFSSITAPGEENTRSPFDMSSYVRGAMERKDIDALKRELVAIDRNIDNEITNCLSGDPINVEGKLRRRDFSAELKRERDSVQLAINFVLESKK